MSTLGEAVESAELLQLRAQLAEVQRELELTQQVLRDLQQEKALDVVLRPLLGPLLEEAERTRQRAKAQSFYSSYGGAPDVGSFVATRDFAGRVIWACRALLGKTPPQPSQVSSDTETATPSDDTVIDGLLRGDFSALELRVAAGVARRRAEQAANWSAGLQMFDEAHRPPRNGLQRLMDRLRTSGRLPTGRNVEHQLPFHHMRSPTRTLLDLFDSTRLVGQTLEVEVAQNEDGTARINFPSEDES